MRLLVLDESPLMAWTVERLCPAGTEVGSVRSFEEACGVLVNAPPDAAVVSVPPATLPWADFQELCDTRSPRVPVLYLSCLFGSSAEAGFAETDGGAEFLRKPVEKADLEGALGRLFEAARRAGRPAG